MKKKLLLLCAGLMVAGLQASEGPSKIFIKGIVVDNKGWRFETARFLDKYFKDFTKLNCLVEEFEKLFRGPSISIMQKYFFGGDDTFRQAVQNNLSASEKITNELKTNLSQEKISQEELKELIKKGLKDCRSRFYNDCDYIRRLDLELCETFYENLEAKFGKFVENEL